MDRPSAGPEVILRDENMSPQSHKFSPAGDMIALHTTEKGFEDLCIYYTNSGEFHREIPAGKLKGYKWSPQGSYLLLRGAENVLIHSVADGGKVGELKVSADVHARFSNDECSLYTAEKDAKSVIKVFNHRGVELAQLAEGRLGPVDPLDQQVASISGKTSFFSTNTFKKVAEIPARLTCYSADGLLMGAYVWDDAQGGEHSLFNRAFECIKRFTFHNKMGYFASINPEKTILTTYYQDYETRFEIKDEAGSPMQVSHASGASTRSFFSLDGTRRILFKREAHSLYRCDEGTRVYVTDVDDEKLEKAKEVLVPESVHTILYTANPAVVCIGNKYLLNLKTCQIIKAYDYLKIQHVYVRKAKHLISNNGSYLSVQEKNGDKIVAIRQLDWSKPQAMYIQNNPQKEKVDA